MSLLCGWSDDVLFLGFYHAEYGSTVVRTYRTGTLSLRTYMRTYRAGLSFMRWIVDQPPIEEQ